MEFSTTTLKPGFASRVTLQSTILFWLFLLLHISASAQDGGLPRAPFWGFGASVSKPGEAAVVRIDAGSAAEAGGVKTGDVLLSIDGKTFANGREFEAVKRGFRTGDTVSLSIRRGGEVLNVKLPLAPLPKEIISGVDVIYDSVSVDDGKRARLIITRPQNRPEKLPAMFLTQWLSCSPIESPLRLTHGWTRILRGLAERSGFVLVRVEKPGLGDSEGAPCSENDFNSDMAAYRAAFKKLKTLDFVDQGNVFIVGSSLGFSVAPILSEGENIRGLIVSGGITKTWFEHMLEIERNRLELTGKTPAEINLAMRPYAEFYSLYLMGRMTPAQIIQRRPELKSVWIDEPEHQYGRPVRFYQQVQELNVEAAWAKVNVPVLMLYGEYDWIMSRADHELAAKIVNQKNPGLARLVILPKTDHSLDVYESREKAFRGEGGKFDEKVVDLMIEWLKEKQVK